MCYSAQVEANQKRLERLFNARRDAKAFKEFRGLQAYEAKAGPEVVKQALGLSRVPRVSQFRWGPEERDCRIYPGYFAPVIIWSGGGRNLVPMRYRVRPAGMPKEIPSRYNVFNCRMDSVTERQTWKKLFGKQHALFPFVSFFEWVERRGKKVQIGYSPQHTDIMWAPALYDTWSSADGAISFRSFAMITDDPPPEVAETGHDRCPIFLNSGVVDQWLQPAGRSQDELISILHQREPVFYEHELLAA